MAANCWEPSALRTRSPAPLRPTPTTPFHHRVLLVAAMSGVAGHGWFSRSPPEDRPLAVEATEQPIESPADHAQSLRGSLCDKPILVAHS